MTFTKGGILNSNQLESISNGKWKKGGILSAEQLNNIDINNKFKTISIQIKNEGEEMIRVAYIDFTNNELKYKNKFIDNNTTEMLTTCAFINNAKTQYVIPWGMTANFEALSISYVSKSNTTIGPVGTNISGNIHKVYPFNLTYVASEIADDELITITITKDEN